MSYTDAPQPSPVAAEVIELLIGGGHKPYCKTDIGPTPAAAVTASRQVIGGGDACELMGYALRETTGAATAALRLRDGNNAATEVIVAVNLAANESVRDMFTPRGLVIATGRVFLEWLSGSIEGVIYWR